MNVSPVKTKHVARLNNILHDKSNKHRALLNSVGSIVKFLPVLDRSNNVKYVLIEEINVSRKTALIMAGGFGKRLGKKTEKTPKPLLKVGKKPILESILQKLEYYNYQKIFVSTHYLSQKIARANPKEERILPRLPQDGPKMALGLDFGGSGLDFGAS